MNTPLSHTPCVRHCRTFLTHYADKSNSLMLENGYAGAADPRRAQAGEAA